MAENTSIEWTDHTWSPWEGCQKVGPGCDHCYAESMNKWLRKGENWGPGAPRRTYSDTHWLKPLKWDAAACAAGKTPKVFPSVCDPFDNAAPDGERERFFRMIEMTPHLTWLLLTKRIGNVKDMLPWRWAGALPANVWLGATVVNQEEADRDIPKLLATPAAVRFLSMEPLLSAVDLRRWLDVSQEVSKHLIGFRALYHQVGQGSGQQGNRVPLAGNLPHGNGLPAILLDTGVVPSDETSEGLLQPVHHAGVRVVDGEPGTVGVAGAPAPVEVALTIEQAGEIGDLPNVTRDAHRLVVEHRAGSPSQALARDLTLNAGATRAEALTDSFDGLAGSVSSSNRLAPLVSSGHLRSLIDWVIVGGESGPGARPMHPAWARSLRDQCAAAGVPFLFKQWGEWIGAGQPYPGLGRGEHAHIREFAYDEVNQHRLHRIGKAAAGRLLDGATHDGFPGTAA